MSAAPSPIPPFDPEDPFRILGFLIHDVAHLMGKRFEQQARAHALGLTRAQAKVLVYLARQEGLNQAALAQVMEIEPITLVRLLDRLEAAGLVERRPDPKDRRARILYLTDAARPLLDGIWGIAAEVRAEAAAGLDAERRQQLIGLLHHLKANLSDRVEHEPAETTAE